MSDARKAETTFGETPTWLVEAAVGTLAREAAMPHEGPWTTWVHAVWEEDLNAPGFDTVTFPDSEGELVHLGRTVAPSTEYLVETLRSVELSSIAKGIVVLVRGRICLDGVLPAVPTLLHPGDAWPDEEGPAEEPFMPRSGVWPAVVAFAMDRSGRVAVLARAADADQARRSGMFDPTFPLEEAAVPFPPESGFTVSQAQDEPRPWMLHALTGHSTIHPKSLPGPALPMLARWLGTLCDIVDLYAPSSDDQIWKDAVEDIDRYATFDTWEKVQADQQGPRELGEWILPEEASRFDTGLFAIAFLMAMPAPPVATAHLQRALDRRQRKDVNQALKQHPHLKDWMRGHSV